MFGVRSLAFVAPRADVQMKQKRAQKNPRRDQKRPRPVGTRSLLGSQFVARENKNLLVGSERSLARGILLKLGSLGLLAAPTTKSCCCQGQRGKLCEWQSRSAHKCQCWGRGRRMTQGVVVGNGREYFAGRQKLCYLLLTWSCHCRCHM